MMNRQFRFNKKLIDALPPPIVRRVALPKLLDNLLKEYVGVSYRYDERGNLVEQVQNGRRSEFE